MKLKDLLRGLEYEVLQQGNALEKEITDVIYDTRNMVPGSVFVCIRGAKLDSHTLALQAVERGAVALVVETPVENVPAGVTVLRTENSRIALALLAANYYGHPAEKMKLIGVTGTKGKTTTTYLLKAILENDGHKVGLKIGRAHV